ncbi:hypothetical protein C0Q70_08023 [Pomacea canaliculata]|uniref:Serine/threonine-protein kinase RIO3 n=1 Tax=Pomacea canaliculata TaxID=400727 RepID=A0A2T7PGQ0_POMCA|nr:hypothetical protein C0Q70_08023 [Pomacea canaliculata]
MATSQTSSPSPWGKTQTVVPCSLEDVMSEQLASQLQEDNNHITVFGSSDVKHTELGTPVSDDDMAAMLLAAGISPSECDAASDELIARMLQLEFDREHNVMLDKEQKKFNGTSKVTVSFENYKTSHPVYENEEEEEDDEDFIPQKTKWEEPDLPRSDYLCGIQQANISLPNKVYNKLKVHSMMENKRSTRHTEKKEHSTADHVMDPRSRLLLYKLINSGVIESIDGPVAGGKESMGHEVPKKIAIKVFKTTLLDFRTREKYVHGDHRFSKDDYKKQNPRRIIKIWAMKEVANLNRMRKFDMPCPSVVLLKKHVLLMSLIGGSMPAPQLKETRLSAADLQDAYEQTVQIMNTMHHQCALVHADLSEYNLLWHDGRVWVIDVSQAVDLTHPQAYNFLYRDCGNISSYFMKQGVHDVLSPEELFNSITGLNIQGTGADFNAQVQRYDKERKESNMLLGTEYTHYAFDYFFDKVHELGEEKGSLDDSISDDEVED